MKIHALFLVLCLLGCRENPPGNQLDKDGSGSSDYAVSIRHARGFEIAKEGDITVIRVLNPWLDAERPLTYALVPRESLADFDKTVHAYDAVIPVPVRTLVVTSTTHIPALEALGVADRLTGFPGTDYISSDYTRGRIDKGLVANLGNNEILNTEMALSLKPDLVIGFGITSGNKAYGTLIRSGIPVVYNGDWTEQTPLGKAEWIKFFAPFFGEESRATSLFDSIETAYTQARNLAMEARNTPRVMSGALYKDVWYAPGGGSWAAEFIRDANGKYLWEETEETGSLSLSLESVLDRASRADIWISPSQFTSYAEMQNSNRHYTEFDPFRNKKIYTYALSKGKTGGLTFFELGPNRPDLILKDLIHIFHPGLLPDHEPYFFKPLE